MLKKIKYPKLSDKFLRFVSIFLALIVLAIPALVAAQTISVPRLSTKFSGIHDTSTAPPSTTIAASPTQILQIVNSNYKISNLSGSGTTGTVSQLVNQSGVFLSDPQTFWDPSTSRFYFSMFENRGTSSPDEGIVLGFSKTATPSSPADFCTYFFGFNYGSTSFPDRQSLGDTSDFLLISSDRFSTSTGAFLGSDTAWVTKPGPGSTCPSQSSLIDGVQSLKNPGGTTFPYSPTSARQTDSSGTGWIISTPTFGNASTLSLYSVTKNITTGGAIIGSPTSISVPAYAIPPTAPQAGQTAAGQPAPSLETREYLTQTYGGFDPRLGHNVLWTAHTVAGGAGSEVRWYEINPSVSGVDQYGQINSPSLYVFNGAIAPDRLISGSTSLYGSDAVITVNTSSSSTYPAIDVVSKEGSFPQSALKRIKQSPGPNVDYTCFQPSYHYCRWGDYPGAAPFPGAPTTGNMGQVWQTNQYNVSSTDDSNVDWRTFVALINP
ncbi:MAG TPA: hypothetical protein VLF63_00630 [Patescibacteria group bacterium]|nr:hypothetical protein [Patescibacteria group bacterium]